MGLGFHFQSEPCVLACERCSRASPLAPAVGAAPCNNYDTGSLRIETDGLWRVIGPTEMGTQPYNPWGEIALWTSRDDGKTWTRTRRVTVGSPRNPTYARKPVNAHDIEHGAKDLKLLIVLSDLRGWKRGDNWGDVDFFARHEADIVRIAVVGEAGWKSGTLTFLGAGRRRAKVEYFTPDQKLQARAWLAS